jgi:hypothetical protein
MGRHVGGTHGSRGLAPLAINCRPVGPSLFGLIFFGGGGMSLELRDKSREPEGRLDSRPSPSRGQAPRGNDGMRGGWRFFALLRMTMGRFEFLRIRLREHVVGWRLRACVFETAQAETLSRGANTDRECLMGFAVREMRHSAAAVPFGERRPSQDDERNRIARHASVCRHRSGLRTSQCQPRTRPPYAVARYNVGSLEVRLGYATWRRGRVELCQKLRLMAL